MTASLCPDLTTRRSSCGTSAAADDGYAIRAFVSEETSRNRNSPL